MSDIVERLRSRETWWIKLHDYVTEKRDKARGTEWFGRFNAIAHAIRGRIPLEEEAASTIEALQARVRELEGELKELRTAMGETDEQ